MTRSNLYITLSNGEAIICVADSSSAPELYIMEIVTTLFRAKLTQGLADFWVAANAIKARTKIVI